MAGTLAVIGNDVQPPTICSHCRADSMSCEVKFGLGGRRCCDDCGHDDDRRRGGDDVVDHHDLHREDHHDLDDVEHHDRHEHDG